MDTLNISLKTKAEFVITINKFDADKYEIYARDTESGDRLIEHQNLSREKTITSLGKLIENILEKGSEKIFMKVTSYHEVK